MGKMFRNFHEEADYIVTINSFQDQPNNQQSQKATAVPSILMPVFNVLYIIGISPFRYKFNFDAGVYEVIGHPWRKVICFFMVIILSFEAYVASEDGEQRMGEN
ncbi:unnamed protein product, partial [Allacma fusca]